MSQPHVAQRAWKRRLFSTQPRGAACGALLLALATPGPGAAAAERSLVELLNGAGAYVVAYEEAFGLVVAEEDYVQRRRLAPGGPIHETRRLRSDVVLVRVPGTGMPWWLLRDVYQVDGASVRDRQDRLEQLLLRGPEDAMEKANAIAGESTRFNLGRAQRNFNVPTLVLALLHPALQPRFSWQMKGESTIEGRRFVELEFRELGTPTVIHGPAGLDLPASGRVFVHDGADGVVGRTQLDLTVPSKGVTTRMRLATEYRPVQALGLWVPAEMADRLQSEAVNARGRISPFEYVEGLARYSRFRRAGVTTEETFRVQEETPREKQP